MWFIALVISGSCEYFSTALYGRMISEMETMWKETDVAGFNISSLCDTLLILPQNSYHVHQILYRYVWIVTVLFIFLYLFIACLYCPIFISYLILHSTFYMLHFFYVCLFPQQPHILTLSLYITYKTSECHGALHNYTLRI